MEMEILVLVAAAGGAILVKVLDIAWGAFTWSRESQRLVQRQEHEAQLRRDDQLARWIERREQAHSDARDKLLEPVEDVAAFIGSKLSEAAQDERDLLVVFSDAPTTLGSYDQAVGILRRVAHEHPTGRVRALCKGLADDIFSEGVEPPPYGLPIDYEKLSAWHERLRGIIDRMHVPPLETDLERASKFWSE